MGQILSLFLYSLYESGKLTDTEVVVFFFLFTPPRSSQSAGPASGICSGGGHWEHWEYFRKKMETALLFFFLG